MRNPTTVKKLQITIACVLLTGAAPLALAQPANDACADAIELICPDGGGSVAVSGSTTAATFDDAGFCGTSNTAPGVWYKVSYDGVLTASTCNAANYDTKISVYEDGCDALTCVAGVDDTAGCGGFTTKLSWGADGDSEYLILVHGFGSATGNFDLTVTCSVPAANDQCEDAIGPLAVDSVTAGSTLAASLDEPPDLDCGTSVTAPGVWYTVIGTGNTMTASTCNDGDPATGGANYDTKISVYCADCEEPECIGGQDDNFDAGCAGFSTKFSWPTKAGRTYLLLVHGYTIATGDFNLAILDDGVPSVGANDCDGVAEAFDLCPDTSIPESVPTSGELGVNRFALVTDDGLFDTVLPPGGGSGPGLSYTIEDTAGCSCEQIIEQLELGAGHSNFGCSISAMEDWLAFLAEASCGNCLEVHGGPGCEVADCEAAICAFDAFCCQVSWDGICVLEAVDVCVPDICVALPSSIAASAGAGSGRSFSEPEPDAKIPLPEKDG